ncbi:hypothetical protein ACTFIY_008180 [Dictyostelium cf. discoideum]
MNTKLRCYYEVLGIEKSAKQDEIKISYRKLALMWHPDKNQHQLSIAEEKFKEINNAYTVLSDPNERKWYDDHREAILRGGRGGSGDGGDDDDDEINLWPYFNTSIFTSFNDNDETGFFKIYSRIFEIIDKIEEGEETINEYHHHPPKFGDSTTPIAEVLKFYSFWKDFVTKKKFTSSDLYHLSDAPNRQIKRLMEKENQKERSKARSAYNERVRHLASFIYNHDKRITEYQKKCLEETERKQREAEIQKQLDEEERQKQIKKFKEEKQREYQLAKQQGLYKDDDDNLYQDNSNNSNFCIICDKAFKSEGQLENHQNSNKHKQELARIRKAVSLDDELLPEDNNSNNNNNNNTNGNDSNEDDDDDEDDEDNNKNKKSKKSKKAKKKSKKVINSQMFNEKSDEFVFGLVNKNKKKSKPQKFIESEEEEEEEDLKENKDLSNDDDGNDNLNSEDEDDLLVTSMLKNFVLTKEKKKNLKEQREKEEKENKIQDDENESEDSANEEDREDDDYDEEDEEEDGDKKVKKDNKKDNKKNTNTTTTTTTDTTTKSKGKAKEKREKKEEKKQQQQQQQQGQTGGESLFCNVCKGEFPSRNKLFQHIKETKHAQAVPSSGVSSGNKKKK